MPVQLAASPLASGQLAASPLASGQLAASPLASGQLAASPLASGQLAASPLASGQLAASPLVSGQHAASPLATDLPDMVAIPGQSLAIGRTEVTVAQWERCVARHGCPVRHPRWTKANDPMTAVSAADAEAYARWLGGVTGRRYRLPSEAEWRIAALAGTIGSFPWGEGMAPGRAVCRDCDPARAGVAGPAPVGSMAANPWGIYDMNGNVWEWTADCWQTGAGLGDGCGQRVVMGGSWYYPASQAASRSRASQDARAASYDIGFRVVRDEAEVTPPPRP